MRANARSGRLAANYLPPRGKRPITALCGAKIDKGWLTLHESGTFVRFTQAVADLFA
jgi:hypothetical protein